MLGYAAACDRRVKASRPSCRGPAGECLASRHRGGREPGPLIYEYAEVWVWFSEEGLPGPRERLVVRRSLDQEPELKYHRSNASPEVPLTKVTQVRATRWTIEEDIKSAKGECGLDEYETRGWVGWHHHTALSLLARDSWYYREYEWGKKEPQMTVPDVRALLVHLLEVREWDVDEILWWSHWRRERNVERP